jgi:hypothetical protein
MWYDKQKLLDEKETPMPVFRKLTPEEANIFKGIGPRKQIEIEYDAYLQDFAPGDIGEALLADDEKRMTVMNRLKSAAKRREPALHLVFRRTSEENLMRFRVSLASTAIAALITQPAARGGKLRKK